MITRTAMRKTKLLIIREQIILYPKRSRDNASQSIIPTIWYLSPHECPLLYDRLETLDLHPSFEILDHFL